MNLFKFMKIKFFTLIELIVVIVVLGILAAIVVPNISSFKEEADEKAIISNARNIQTAVDMFALKNHGATPTEETPTLGNPQVIQVYGLQPDYLRETPKVKGVKYWLDQNNTVWASMVDAPTEVKYDGTISKLTWKTVDGAEMYKVYKSDDAVTSSAKKGIGMKHLDDIKATNNVVPEANVPALSRGEYLVTAVDKFGFESAPTKVDTLYKEYLEPDKSFTFDSFSKQPVIPKIENAIIAFEKNNPTNEIYIKEARNSCILQSQVPASGSMSGGSVRDTFGNRQLTAVELTANIVTNERWSLSLIDPNYNAKYSFLQYTNSVSNVSYNLEAMAPDFHTWYVIMGYGRTNSVSNPNAKYCITSATFKNDFSQSKVFYSETLNYTTEGKPTELILETKETQSNGSDLKYYYATRQVSNGSEWIPFEPNTLVQIQTPTNYLQIKAEAINVTTSMPSIDYWKLSTNGVRK